MKRKKIIAGNWKMHMTAAESAAFVHALAPLIKDAACEVYIAPPFTSIGAVAKATQGSRIRIGAQNMSEYHKGAFTGEISSLMLKEAGASFVILGHSERRQIFHEDDQTIHHKIKWAIKEGLEPLVCIGETEEEREKGHTQTVLETQLRAAFSEMSGEQMERVTLAYEPVWAIGTGQTATPHMAEEVHQLCRGFIADVWGEKVADHLPILYGGSVKPDNIKELINQPSIDGALVGGASLEVTSFSEIIHNA